ncbi:hypothetical protein F5Y18DRAFT_248574 [Xylariaceae sp. FL1019]|nr:hypothetical protein F5Y18DRAFT_248574 [Xylariaceae sp. FL1019]
MSHPLPNSDVRPSMLTRRIRKVRVYAWTTAETVPDTATGPPIFPFPRFVVISNEDPKGGNKTLVGYGAMASCAVQLGTQLYAIVRPTEPVDDETNNLGTSHDAGESHHWVYFGTFTFGNSEISSDNTSAQSYEAQYFGRFCFVALHGYCVDLKEASFEVDTNFSTEYLSRQSDPSLRSISVKVPRTLMELRVITRLELPAGGQVGVKRRLQVHFLENKESFAPYEAILLLSHVKEADGQEAHGKAIGITYRTKGDRELVPLTLATIQGLDSAFFSGVLECLDLPQQHEFRVWLQCVEVSPQT